MDEGMPKESGWSGIEEGLGDFGRRVGGEARAGGLLYVTLN